jgi:hypothetical protein
MFIEKLRATALASFAGLALLAGIFATAPSAIAAPQQAPSGIASCADFPAADQAALKLPGTISNDSCVVAFIDIDNCTLEVRLVVNVTTKSPILGYKWVRRVGRKTIKRPVKTSTYASTTSDNYNIILFI